GPAEAVAASGQGGAAVSGGLPAAAGGFAPSASGAAATGLLTGSLPGLRGLPLSGERFPLPGARPNNETSVPPA
ncbi:complement resistance protein TraT, partial [Streptomyces fuscigenes]|nr:complement resistance protein TraT [Streptomyces fuscigenes]